MADHLNADERAALAPYFTNLDDPVFALVNLPEVVKGALFARYSRSPKSLRRLFLDEFIQGGELPWPAVAAPRHGMDRAERLFDRVFLEYGDDSVAQLGGVHLAVEGASNILTKVLEWGRLMAYLEQSTRYVPYDDRPGGRWRYHVPEELTGELRDRYVTILNAGFETYASWIPRLRDFFAAKFPRELSDSEASYRMSIRAKALDTLRGLLPAATISNVGLYGSAQSYEQLIIRMRAHPLAEVHACADRILRELRKVIPAFLKRIDLPDRGIAWSAYLAETRTATREVASALLKNVKGEQSDEVTLSDFDPEGEVKVVAACLYSVSSLPDTQLLGIARQMDEETRRAVLRAYIGLRGGRRHRPGRALERTSYRFDILSDYGAFRDLQRHRLLSLEWQRLSPHHGYVIPEIIAETGASDDWRRVMDNAAGLYDEIASSGLSDVASYALPMAYRIRYYMDMNAREALHMLELRTAAQGHESYRRVCQKMHRLIREQAGHEAIAAAMHFVDHSTVELERRESERLAEARRQTKAVGTLLYTEEFVRNVPKARPWDNRPLVQLLGGQHADSSNEIERIERWFRELSAADEVRKRSLRGNLLSLNPMNFWSALYELMTARLVEELGCGVEYEPSMDDVTPDFVVRAKELNDFSFVGEVLTMCEDGRNDDAEAQLYEIASALDEIHHRVGVFVERASLPSQRPSSWKPLLDRVRRWLDDCERGGARKLHLSPPEWSLHLILSALDTLRATPEPIVAGVLGPMGKTETDEGLRGALAKKVIRFSGLKEPPMPLVIFVWEGDRLTVTETSLEWALYGRDQLTMRRKGASIESEWTRAPGGLFGFGRSGGDEPMNRRLSAVVYCARVWHEGRVYVRARVYHHPYANIRVPLEVFGGLPQCIPVDVRENHVRMRWGRLDWTKDQPTMGVLLR
jgi:thymidylate synthase ThyX